MILKRLSLPLLAIIFGCQPVFAQKTLVQADIPQDTVITLRRLPGVFGDRADYGLTVAADGALVLERFKNFKVVNTIKGNISCEKVAQLIAEFEKVNFFSLKDRYAEVEDGCPVVGTDQPYAIVSFQMKGRKKTIAHYYGCGNRHAIGDVFPSQLFNLEKMIDEIIGTNQHLK